MPQINYRICTPEMEADEQRDMEEAENVRVKVDPVDSKDVIKSVVKKFPRDKWICFFPDSKTLRQSEAVVKEVFPGYETVILLSKNHNLNEVVKKAKNTERIVILSVDILLEGVHLPSIDGIVLYRNVGSLNAFMQMIGRTTTIGKKIEPVVIDCSSSARKLLSKMLHSFYKIDGNSYHGSHKSTKDVIKIGITGEESFDINKLYEFAFGDRNLVKVGDRNMMKCGMACEVIEYNNSHDITVRFDDGIVREHVRASRFHTGQIGHRG